ncbi:MAG: succinylglutamate desuccinylase/aspartoacylase family protein [Candidatus Saccharimonadales bacterium]
MYEEILQVIGKKDGPTSMIIGGVHGNERCGFEALRDLLPTIEIERGTVFFAYGNPRAIEKDVRFTEVNLNRMFVDDDKISESDKKSYEYKRSLVLKSYLDKVEVLFDIHASSIPTSPSFAICEANAKGIVDYLPTDLVVAGFDDIEPGGTDGYMNSMGKIGISLECGYLDDSKTTEIAKQAIFAFLKACGHIKNDLNPRKQIHIRMYDMYLAKTDSFRLERQFDNFEILEKGQLIGIDGNQEIRAEKRCLIVFAHNGKKIGDEVFLLGEEKSSLA